MDKIFCNSWHKESQSRNDFMKAFQFGYLTPIANACKSTCNKQQYSGQKTITRPKSSNATNRIEIHYVFTSSEVQIYEEYLMFNPNDLIGTIGGHSGLFIGFSFYGFICTILEFIKKKFEVLS